MQRLRSWATRRLQSIVGRYGRIEIWASLAFFTGGIIGWFFPLPIGGRFAGATLGSNAGENICFYGCILVRAFYEAWAKTRGHASIKRIVRTAGHGVFDLIAEYVIVGPIDFLVRPFITYFGLWLFGQIVPQALGCSHVSAACVAFGFLGIFIAKIFADIWFYLVAERSRYYLPRLIGRRPKPSLAESTPLA